MTDAIIPLAQGQPATLDAATADRIAWVIEQIADGGYTVSPPGLPWAGQQAIAQGAQEHFTLERPEAERLVEMARLDLWQGSGGAAAGHVERRLLMARLNVIRRVILQAVREPKRTTTYIFKRKKNSRTGEVTMVRIPRREQIREGFDVNAVRMLIDIEGMIAKLNDLGNGGNTELVAEIFKQLEKDAEGQTKEKVVASISQKVKNMDIARFSDAGQEVIQRAVAQERRKKVPAKAVEDTAHEPDQLRSAVRASGNLPAPDGRPDEAGGLDVPPAEPAGR